MQFKRILFPRKHTATVKYIALDPQPKLEKYDDIKNIGAIDQYDVVSFCYNKICIPFISTIEM